MSDEPLIEVTLPGSVDEVWPHLRDPALVGRWFGWEYEGLEGEIEFIFVGASPEALAEIGMPEDAGMDVDDEAHTITWRYGGSDQDRFELRPDGPDCVLRVTRTVSPDSWDGVYDGQAEGWISFVHQLRVRPPAPPRRGAPHGLHVVPGHRDRRRVRRDRRRPGRAARGPGCSAPTPGARVTSGSGPSARSASPSTSTARPCSWWPRPPDAASMTLSLYGRDDAEVADLTRRWNAWWVDHVGTPDPESPYH